MLSSDGLITALGSAAADERRDRLSILPAPEHEQIREKGAASLDLRLGRWFRSLRPARLSQLEISGKEISSQDTSFTKEHFVAFGSKYILHPRNFVLGITLEWMHIPAYLAGYVTGKSSLGRRGLIIETASGIQPGFTGCLALELSNVGEVPIALEPGMLICQIFLHKVDPPSASTKSQFAGRRKPVLGNIKLDQILVNLSKKESL